MKLLSLSLRGAVGIERGLGQQQIDIDFEQFDAGLVALVAPNGSGKTTILENLHPYRCLVSRQGALQNHFFLRDSHRILRFEMNSDTYEVKLLIDGQTGKQESYLARNGEPLTDGKTTSYDALVAELFGSEDLFFRSLFRGQGAESITELKPAQRKTLFVELLGLSVLERYHESAKQKAAACEKRLEGVRSQIRILREQAEGLAAEEATVAAAQEDLTRIVDAQREASSAFERAEAARLEAERKLADMAADIERQNELSREESEVSAALQRTIRAIESAEQQHREAIEGITRHRLAALKRTGEQRQDLAARLERAQRLASNRDLITEKLAEMDALGENLRAHTARRTERDAILARCSEDSEQYRLAEFALERWDVTRQDIERRLAKLHDEAELAQMVPCALEAPSIQPHCKLLARALEADEEEERLLRELLAHVETKPLLPDTHPTRTRDAALAALGYDQAAHDAATAQLLKLQGENWHKLEAEAATAEDTVRDTSSQLVHLAAEEERIVRDADQRTTEEDARLARERADREAERQSLEKKRADLLRKLGDMAYRRSEEPELRAALTAAQREKDVAQLTLQSLADDHTRATRTLAASEARAEQCRSAAREAGALAEGSEADERELTEWALLARATGKDGIQALELDAAGPNVSAIANQLLADTFGSQFQIAFETTRQSADGKKQLETFDIRVYADGTEQTIENLSGGQRVWIEAALSQAIAIYLRRKSGLDLRTSYLDESDGALDADNAFHYLAMLRHSHELAGTHHTFLITHRQELLALIPQQIRLIPGEGIRYDA